ncbi:hypothetical protein SNEBB_000292 [Seison nebaliae]|nr:hypothetical protein SNEBB_000292 [Seison nebaliae]
MLMRLTFSIFLSSYLINIIIACYAGSHGDDEIRRECLLAKTVGGNIYSIDRSTGQIQWNSFDVPSAKIVNNIRNTLVLFFWYE